MSAQPKAQTDTKESTQTDAVLEAISHGATIKDLRGISDSLMEGIYAYAYDFYNKGRLDEAETFFKFLSIYDFYNIDYMMGLAAVHQLKKNYQKAIDIYAVAFAINKGIDYKPIFFSGQCLLYLAKTAKAKKCFAIVCNDSKDEALRTKSQIYLDTISKTLNKDDAEEYEE